jgi:hypothetical protein
MKRMSIVVLVFLTWYAGCGGAEQVILLVAEGVTQTLLNRVYTPALDALIRHSTQRTLFFRNFHLII